MKLRKTETGYSVLMPKGEDARRIAVSDPLLAKQHTLDGLVNQMAYAGDSYANQAKMIKLQKEIDALKKTQVYPESHYVRGWAEDDILNPPLYHGHLYGVKIT